MLRSCIILLIAINLALSLFCSITKPVPHPLIPPSFWNEIICWGVLVLSTSFLILFAEMARFFNRLGREDNWIEDASAMFCLIAAEIFFYSFLKLRHINIEEKKIYSIVALFF